MKAPSFKFERQTPPVGYQEAAEWWFARRSLGRLNARDEALFEDWRTDPANAAHYAAVETLYVHVGAFAAEAQILRMRSDALRARPARPKRGAGIAAGIVAVFTLGLALAGVIYAPQFLREEPPGAASEPRSKRYETRLGEQQRLRLDDGSIVTLNTSSLLEVAYNKGRRDVRLVRGQALFQVAHNPAWPFVVTVADRQVTAVGTAFDVRLDGASVRVVLLEGKVRIDPLRREGVERLFPRLAEETLSPGEGLVARQGIARIKVAAADVERATSWTHGQVIFRDDSLAAAVTELNRYSETRILVNDPRVAALKVSGVFATDRSHNFVAAVTSFYPVEARQSALGVTELVWRGAG